MRLIDAIEHRNILRNLQTNSTYYGDTKCRELIGEIINLLDEQPTVEPPQKVVAEIKGIEEATVSRMIKDLLAEHEAAKEHEHNYIVFDKPQEWIATEWRFKSDAKRKQERTTYKKATLLCTRCGELKCVEYNHYTEEKTY